MPVVSSFEHAYQKGIQPAFSKFEKEKDAYGYSTIKYRDCSVGAFLYAHLKKTGIQKLVTEGKGEFHNQYLTKMGFAEENGKFSKTL